MAQTTLMPLDPALSPQQVNRVLAITADLLPEEVTAARRARRNRAWVLAVVGVVVLALAGWYVLADSGTRDANAELETITAEQSRLQRKQATYNEVVNVQSENGEISKQLSALMKYDLQWAVLLDTLRSTGTDSNVTVRNVSVTIAALNSNGAPTGALPSTSGAASVGTATITGEAPDKEAVAEFIDKLGKVSTLANPTVTSVVLQEDDDIVEFNATVDVTTEALCGRFTVKCKSTGGN